MLLFEEPKQNIQLIDMHGRIVAGEKKGQLVVELSQEVPGEFWEENARRREMSKLCIPDLMGATRMPEIIAHEVKQRYGIDPWDHFKGREAQLDHVRAIIWCLRHMGEERCITTVHRI